MRGLPARRASSAPFPVRGRARRPAAADVPVVQAWLVVGVLTLLALAVRLVVTRGLWLDEAISVGQAQLTPAGIVQDLADGDRHPPLHHLVLWATIRLLGDGDLAVRLPSIVAGVLLVPVLHLLGAALHDRRTGVLAAGLGAIAPALVWYSQEARGYVFVALFGTALVLGAVGVVRRGRRRDWALTVAGASLAVWTHWFALLLVAAVGLLLVATLVTRAGADAPIGTDLRRGVVALLAFAIQLVPLGLLAAAQLEATGTGGGYAGADAAAGEGVSFYTVVANLSWAVWGFHPPAVIDLLNAAWPLLMLASLAFVLGRRPGRATVLLLWCILAPVVALGALAVVNPALFELRYFMAVVPLGFVLLARVILRAPRGGGRLLAGALVATTLLAALVDQQVNPDNARRYDFREALAQVQATTGPRDVVLYQPPELRYVLDRYAPGLRARPLEGPLPTRRLAREVVVVGAFLEQERYREILDRQVGALEFERRRVGRDRLPGVELWRFR